MSRPKTWAAAFRSKGDLLTDLHGERGSDDDDTPDFCHVCDDTGAGLLPGQGCIACGRPPPGSAPTAATAGPARIGAS